MYHVSYELGGKCPTAHDSSDPNARGEPTQEAKRNVRLAVVAEKGARAEAEKGRPLIGTTGQYTRRHLARAGIDPAHVWLTNTCHYYSDPDANPTDEEIIREQPRLIRELGLLPNLRCIIALGSAAMRSLSNFHLDGIIKRRGSRLPTVLGIKMVPTPHPSFYVNGEWRYRSVVQFDFNRAVRDAAFAEVRHPKRTYNILPSFHEALDYLDHLDGATRAIEFDHGPMCEFDIEAVQGRSGRWYMSQIAFANNPDEGFCIPLMHVDRRDWWTPRQEFIIRRRVAVLLSHEDWTYGTQNGLYDCFVLRCEGIKTPHMSRGFDTMYAHKLLAPDLPHDLAFIDSIYTDEAYYKDESGRNTHVQITDEQFQVYNCKDAVTQCESAVSIRRDLAEVQMLDFYYEHVQAQWPIVHDDLQVGGMRINRSELANINTTLDAEVEQAEGLLLKLVGWAPNTRSPLDMEKLYTQFSIPIQRTKKGLAKRGEDLLLNYANKYTHFAPIVSCMLEITRRKTLKSNFLSMALDPHGFYHPGWKLFGTTTFRLACEGSDEGGPQVLNTPYKLRHVFIPDRDDHEFTKADLKQAEKMIVVYDSQDMSLIPAFEQDKDVHRVVGTWIYLNWNPANGLPPDALVNQIEKFCVECLARGDKECTHSRRFVAKQCNHAFDYLMGVRKFVTEILPASGIFMPESEGKRIRARIVTPALARWQSSVADACKHSMWFTNLFGMKREFYGIPGNDLYREILAWLASSVVSCITAQAMRRFRRWSDQHGSVARIVHQGYDALLVSHPIAERENVRSALEAAFYHPLVAHGREFRIPAEFEHGANWAMKKPVAAGANTMIASGDA